MYYSKVNHLLIGKYVIYAIVIEITLSRSPGSVQENIKIVINDGDIQNVITTLQ